MFLQSGTTDEFDYFLPQRVPAEHFWLFGPAEEWAILANYRPHRVSTVGEEQFLAFFWPQRVTAVEEEQILTKLAPSRAVEEEQISPFFLAPAHACS